jgi:hypothetical protein
MGVTLIKYVPQVHLNALNQSTEGWSIDNVLLDLSGGLLSVGQLLVSCDVLQDWTAVTGGWWCGGCALRPQGCLLPARGTQTRSPPAHRTVNAHVTAVPRCCPVCAATHPPIHTGNPIKFGLGLVSIGFDAVFMLQHYVWYRAPSSISLQQQLLKQGQEEAALVVSVDVASISSDEDAQERH